jgi:hypothetical protein
MRIEAVEACRFLRKVSGADRPLKLKVVSTRFRPFGGAHSNELVEPMLSRFLDANDRSGAVSLAGCLTAQGLLEPVGFL